MKRHHQSGWEKQKKKKKHEEEAKKLLKIDAFFNKPSTNRTALDLQQEQEHSADPLSSASLEMQQNDLQLVLEAAEQSSLELLSVDPQQEDENNINKELANVCSAFQDLEQMRFNEEENRHVSTVSVDPQQEGEHDIEEPPKVSFSEQSKHPSLDLQQEQEHDTVQSSSLGFIQSDNTTDDIGNWLILSENDKQYWTEKGPEALQNWDGPFEKSKMEFSNQVRFCSSNVFLGKRMNNEPYPREWLCYSLAKGRIYCFACKLFGCGRNSFSGDGFNDWRNTKVISMHEDSNDHRNAMLALLARQVNSGIDSNVHRQIDKEKEYLRQILQRVIGVVKFLGERGLPLRGHDEKLNTPENGNFLGIMELISKFDPYLAEHINKYGNQGSGKTSYLSKTIYEEIVQMLAAEVRKQIITDVKAAGYFSISVDSTPDVSHVDQLTVIVRYVEASGHPVERFLGFLELASHTGKDMAQQVVSFLVDECGLNFSKCRGQSYDNAANMSGEYYYF